MNQFGRRILVGLILLFLLLPMKPAAQLAPTRLAGGILSEKLSRQLTANLQRTLVEETLAPALGAQLAGFPPITPQQVFRNGEQVSIVPREDLRRQIDYLTRYQIPVEKAHAYTQGLQLQFSNRENFFEMLALGYYNRHFVVHTPNLLGVIQKIGSLQDPALEKRFLKRLEELISYKAQIAQKFPKINAKTDLRVRYLNDIDALTAENFQESKLVISIEQRLQASAFRTPFAHVRGGTTFPVGKDKNFRVYNYNGPVEYIPHLYNYLVTAGDSKTDLFLEINVLRRSLLLYNYDRTVWLRVTPHEYENPKHFHVHLHKLTLQDITVNKREHYEPVLLNLSIPLKKPDIPLKGPHLYKAFVQNPFNYFKDNPRVHITVK